jgi:hypothetical protein
MLEFFNSLFILRIACCCEVSRHCCSWCRFYWYSSICNTKTWRSQVCEFCCYLLQLILMSIPCQFNVTPLHVCFVIMADVIFVLGQNILSGTMSSHFPRLVSRTDVSQVICLWFTCDISLL